MNLCFALTQAALTRCSATAHTVTRPEGGAGSTSRRTLRFVDRRGRGRWRLTLVVSTAMASDTLNLMLLRENGDSANNDEHLAIREQEAVLAVRIARLENILRGRMSSRATLSTTPRGSAPVLAGWI